jgi:hypothetical protein
MFDPIDNIDIEAILAEIEAMDDQYDDDCHSYWYE